MTANVDIVNRSLQTIGTRTTITQAELTNQSSNEAIQSTIILEPTRDELLRMAPWNCATNFINLTLITAAPGTPENLSATTQLWQKGQPPTGWIYEYQYPVDCIRPLWISPQFQLGFAGIPISQAVVGARTGFSQYPPVKFNVGVDQFVPVTSAVVVSGGSGYIVGDIITLPIGPTTSPPIGAPVQLQVAATIAGVITSVNVVSQVFGASPPAGGSYFAPQTGTIAQASTTGAGTGATFILNFGLQGDQRVIYTNQEFAVLSYLKRVVDPNVMDPLFINAWCSIVGAKLVMALSGDKILANAKVKEANDYILEARKADGNEGLTVNDVVPDFIRVRGVSFSTYAYGSNLQFDWGALWSTF